MSETKPKYNFWTNYIETLKKYFQVQGRSNRYEYWGFVLMNILIVSCLSLTTIILAIISAASPQLAVLMASIVVVLYGIEVLFRLFIVIPTITVTARRLHDINKSGWWMLLPLLFFIGVMVLTLIIALIAGLGLISSNSSVIKGALFIFAGLGLIVSYFYVLYLLCKKSVNEENRFGELSEGVRDDKEGVKFIIAFFIIFISLFIIGFIVGFVGAAKEFSSKQSSSYTQDYYIPEGQFENYQMPAISPDSFNGEGDDIYVGYETLDENIMPEESENYRAIENISEQELFE